MEEKFKGKIKDFENVLVDVIPTPPGAGGDGEKARGKIQDRKPPKFDSY